MGSAECKSNVFNFWLPRYSMELTGAAILMECLKREGVDVVLAIPAELSLIYTMK